MPLATQAEAVAEYTRNVGAEEPERAWILSSYDTWERNPHYIGPWVPHPEADEYYGDDADADHGQPLPAQWPTPATDDLPF